MDWRAWRDLELRDVLDWPLAAQRTLLLATGLGIWVLLGLLLAWPMWDELQAAQRQHQQLETQATAQRMAAADWPQVQRQHAQAQQQWRVLQRRFPERLQPQQALEVLDELAKRHHIDIQAMRVQGVTRQDTHQEQAIRIEATGDYHDWGRWMAALLEAEPVMWVSTLEAGSADARGGQVKLAMTVVCAAQPEKPKEPS